MNTYLYHNCRSNFLSYTTTQRRTQQPVGYALRRNETVCDYARGGGVKTPEGLS